MDCRIAKTKEDYNKIMKLREDVFILEQGISREEEYDEYDKTATHFGVFEGDKIIGCGRVIINYDGTAKIGRIAVDKNYRRKGYGYLLCTHLVQIAKDKGAKKIVLHGQLPAVPLYRKVGFIEIGEPFWEAGILHLKMELI
jgi:predicted GNAT family N-acyltransferase